MARRVDRTPGVYTEQATAKDMYKYLYSTFDKVNCSLASDIKKSSGIILDQTVAIANCQPKNEIEQAYKKIKLVETVAELHVLSARVEVAMETGLIKFNQMEFTAEMIEKISDRILKELGKHDNL